LPVEDQYTLPFGLFHNVRVKGFFHWKGVILLNNESVVFLKYLYFVILLSRWGQHFHFHFDFPFLTPRFVPSIRVFLFLLRILAVFFPPISFHLIYCYFENCFQSRYSSSWEVTIMKGKVTHVLVEVEHSLWKDAQQPSFVPLKYQLESVLFYHFLYIFCCPCLRFFFVYVQANAG
jgi:hypothetical protein